MQARLTFCAMLLTATAARAQAPSYVATDIGSLAGKATLATAMNEQGQVVGYSFVTDFGVHVGAQSHAFLYENGAITDLFPPSDVGSSAATAINESGQIVGYRRWDSMSPSQPFVWEPGPGVTLLNPFGALPVAATGAANGINDDGQIVGIAATSDFVGRAFRLPSPWLAATASNLTPDLSAPYFWSVAVAVNNFGHVVWTQGKPAHFPATWDTADSFYSDGLTTTLLDDLLPGRSFEAQALNEAGQVVGYAVGGSTVEAFVFASESMTPLAALVPEGASRAHGINAGGNVVGTATDSSGSSRAVLWKGDGVYDLNDALPGNSGVVLTEARAINDLGQIVAWGHLAAEPAPALLRSFLLTPFSPATAISDLLEFIHGLDLQRGIETSLTQKLRNALAALEAGDTQSACDLLASFINEVEAQAGQKIDDDDAARAIQDAERVRAALGCGP